MKKSEIFLLILISFLILSKDMSKNSLIVIAMNDSMCDGFITILFSVI